MGLRTVLKSWDSKESCGYPTPGTNSLVILPTWRMLQAARRSDLTQRSGIGQRRSRASEETSL
jgi:hypothetical protein